MFIWYVLYTYVSMFLHITYTDSIMDQRVPGSNPGVPLMRFPRLAADTAKFVVADLP